MKQLPAPKQPPIVYVPKSRFGFVWGFALLFAGLAGGWYLFHGTETTPQAIQSLALPHIVPLVPSVAPPARVDAQPGITPPNSLLSEGLGVLDSMAATNSRKNQELLNGFMERMKVPATGKEGMATIVDVGEALKEFWPNPNQLSEHEKEVLKKSFNAVSRGLDIPK